MDIILDHLATDQPYADSLKYHFGNICGTWAFTINRSIFESLKSEGLALISNKELRLELVKLYDVQAMGQKERNERYRDIVDAGSESVLSTRFDAFWNANYDEWSKTNSFSNINYSTDGLVGEMVPLDYEKLKSDQEFLYFIKSLKNRHFWFFQQEFWGIKESVTFLLQQIDDELERLSQN